MDDDDRDLGSDLDPDMNSTVLKPPGYKRPNLLEVERDNKMKKIINNREDDLENLISKSYQQSKDLMILNSNQTEPKENPPKMPIKSNQQEVNPLLKSNYLALLPPIITASSTNTVVSTVLNDLPILKTKLGRFEVFNQDAIEPEAWFTAAKDYLNKNY